MKLELKHLSYYLPYELRGKFNLKDVDERHPDRLEDKFLRAENVYFFLTYCKPLLIPMSELPKQAKATVVGIRNIDQINSKCCYHIYHKDGETVFNDLPEQMPIEDVWDTYEQLFAGHYDVFGLIEQGLALNKLTILLY